MATSLEGRAPFLDHRLIDFAVKLPTDLRVRANRGKHLLRRAAARWLPPPVLQKKKQGFAIPLGQWFRGPLRGLASDLIESQDGSWWLVCLGVRPQGNPPCYHLGRETFLAPVTWNDQGWPHVGEKGPLAAWTVADVRLDTTVR